ncbi:hypothetical protein AwWohl_03380 [Gammaproteobacteria bacterium]|nr:hypothetical protein AwWohl_03380 [Gammaproteobacteria bacterium]
MAAEFILSFFDKEWYQKNKSNISKKIQSLSTFKSRDGNEYQLLSDEFRNDKKDWLYNVRLFIEETNIFIEIATHPLSTEDDLCLLFRWIRKQSNISINDEDGEVSGWLN